MLAAILALIVTPAPIVCGAPPYQEDDPQARANALYDEGKELQLAGELEAALTKFETALPLYQVAGDRPGEALCLLTIGTVERQLTDYPDALDAFEASLRIWREIDNRVGEGTTLNSIGGVYHALGQNLQALEFYQQALSIARTINNRKAEGIRLNNIGVVYRDLGEYEQALDYYQQALAIREEIDDRTGEGVTLNNIGLVYDDLGQCEQALGYLQQALEIRRALHDQRGEAETLNNIGLVHSDLGRYEQALDHYQQALAIAQAVDDWGIEGSTRNNIGAVYDDLGQYRQALDYYLQALDLRRTIHDRSGEVVTLNNLGLVYARLAQYDQALDYHQQAAAILQQIDRKVEVGTTLNNIGAIFESLGQYEEALDAFRRALTSQRACSDRAGEGATLNNMAAIYAHQGQYDRALNTYQQALTIREEINDQAGVGATLGNIGVVYDEMGQYEQALAAFQQALTIRKEIGDRAGQGRTLANIGVLYEQLGDTSQAICFYQRAIDMVESIQGEIQVEELTASFAGKQTDTYAQLVNLLRQEGRLTDAFNYAERARARVFLDQIGNRQVDFRRGAAPELIDQEQALCQRIIGLQSALNTEMGKPFDVQNQELLKRLSTGLEEARSGHEEMVTRLKLASPEYASLVSVSTLSLEEVQEEILDQDTTLIEYFVLDDQVLAWVVDLQGFEWVALEIGRDDLQNQVEFLNELIRTREFDTEVAVNLYNALFSPLKPYIRRANLVIVPHGVLHYLPFAALWDAENERYLVEDYALTYAPSASVLQYILDKRNADEGRLLALGNPNSSLLHSEAEAKAIAGLYGAKPLLRGEATESQIYAQAGEVDLLHLAAHGVYNPYNALYSRIELAADDAQDGNLEVHEVFGLDLTGANLVVLSACETALGEQSEGDELVGLTRAFLYAGTPAVVTTLWPIDDAASGALMEAFYGHLREGLSNAEALRAAQLDVLAREGWGEPYYWAAFSLTGDYLGSGEPKLGMASAPEPTEAAPGVETPTSAPAVEPSPTSGGGRGGLYAGAALALGLVLVVSVGWLYVRRRARP